MLLLGVDEGTTGVKAALFDEQLRPVREARRDKVNRHPKPGWVEQDGEEVLQAVVEAVGELLEAADEEVVACGLDHQGESVLAWDARDRRAAQPDRGLAGQALAGGPRPDGRRGGGDPVAQRPALRPLLLRGQARLAARERRRRPAGARRRDAADGNRRLVPVRPARRRVRDRQLHRLPHPAPPARHARLRRPPVRALRRSARRAAGGARHGGRARHAAPRVVAGRAEAVRSGRGPAGSACGRWLRGARPREGHLRNGRVRARARGRRGAAPHRRPPADGRLADRRPHGVRDRRRRVRGRRDARVDVPRAWHGRDPGGADRAGARRGRQRRSTRAARPRGRRRALVEARRARGDGGDARRHHARERRARGPRGHRLARGGRRGRDARERGGGLAARGRRPHERAAAASAAGGHDRRARGRRGRRRDGARCRRPRRGRRGRDPVTGRRR